MADRMQRPGEASQARLALARVLAEKCPPDLAPEIAVTGSAARGMADDTSDVEINVWGGAVPPESAWRRWLEGAGANDVSFKFAWEADITTFCWAVCRLDGIWIEVGFSMIEEFEAFIEELVGGSFVDHLRMQMGWTVEQAVPLRTAGRLAAWKQKVATYPEGLAERIVADQTEVWSDPHVPGVRWALAARGERLGLALRFTWDMQNLLRVLFAINHTWDHDLKWTRAPALDLPLKPVQLWERIDAAFTFSDLGRSVDVEQRLIVDALELAQRQGFDVDAALRSVREGLRTHANQP
jgi:hypothetical protein